MDMRDDQGANTMDRKIYVQVVGVRPATGGTVAALEQTAVDQQAVLFVEHQFMRGAGDAVDRAVVENVEPVCHAFFPESGSRLKLGACRNSMVWRRHCLSPAHCDRYYFCSPDTFNANGQTDSSLELRLNSLRIAPEVVYSLGTERMHDLPVNISVVVHHDITETNGPPHIHRQILANQPTSARRVNASPIVRGTISSS